MEQQTDNLELLDLMIRPGFCVKDNTILRCNRAARGLLLNEGDDIIPLLLTGQEAYKDFSGGCLYLSMGIHGQVLGASVCRIGSEDIFILDSEADNAELQVLALAARELREPLSNLLISAEKVLQDSGNPETARLNQGLFQLMRIIGNMSDAHKYASQTRQETRDITRLMDTIFEKARQTAAQVGIELQYTGCEESIYCLVDEEQLERAILNILSNSLKFLPDGGSIRAEFTRCGRNMRLSIADSGSGIAQDILANVFRQYLRQPAIEERRHGLGLGMVLVRSAAANHGGTVLIDQTESGGTRVTMTLAIRQSAGTTVRTPVLRVDYAGERDHTLLEFSESLPSHLYQ